MKALYEMWLQIPKWLRWIITLAVVALFLYWAVPYYFTEGCGQYWNRSIVDTPRICLR